MIADDERRGSYPVLCDLVPGGLVPRTDAASEPRMMQGLVPRPRQGNGVVQPGRLPELVFVVFIFLESSLFFAF